MPEEDMIGSAKTNGSALAVSTVTSCTSNGIWKWQLWLTNSPTFWPSSCCRSPLNQTHCFLSAHDSCIAVTSAGSFVHGLHNGLLEVVTPSNGFWTGNGLLSTQYGMMGGLDLEHAMASAKPPLLTSLNQRPFCCTLKKNESSASPIPGMPIPLPSLLRGHAAHRASKKLLMRALYGMYSTNPLRCMFWMLWTVGCASPCV